MSNVLQIQPVSADAEMTCAAVPPDLLFFLSIFGRRLILTNHISQCICKYETETTSTTKDYY